MTDRGKQLLRGLAMNLQLVMEHDKVSPAEVDQILAALVSHLRAWKPQALSTSLETGPVGKVVL